MLTFRQIAKFTKVIETEALLKKLQTKPLVTLTRDDYQLNMGLVIQRDPIFLYNTEEEMKLIKYRYQLSKKHNLICKLPKEMHEYTHYTGENDQVEDHGATHVRLVGDERTTFMENSKYFKHSDPYEKNNKLIQYNGMYTVYLLVKQNGVWQFPNTSVEDKETFQETKLKFFTQLSNNLWEVYYFNRKPRFVTQDENQKGKVKGVKTYHFQALHIKGKVQVFGYEDWCWASRLEMNKYLKEDTYKQVIHGLDL